MGEHALTNLIVTLADQHGWSVAHLRAGRWPTTLTALLLARDGELLIVELYTGRPRSLPERDVWFAALKARGAEAHSWSSKDKAAALAVLERPRKQIANTDDLNKKEP